MSSAKEVSALDVLCPMHLILGPSGHILHAGPTLCKMRKGQGLSGQRFLEVFEVKRPRALNCMADLMSDEPQKLRLKLRAAPHTAFKGVLVPAKDGDGTMIVNLSFGISILDGVRDFALTNADFAATDLAIEMLYLIEAKTAAMEASYNLNSKLQGAKIAAEEQAYTDTLTGLKNRRALDTVLTRLLSASNSFAVMHIDLDYFKTVNDTLGHAAGDHVLQHVARIMVDETRSHDLVARVGGMSLRLSCPKCVTKAPCAAWAGGSSNGWRCRSLTMVRIAGFLPASALSGFSPAKAHPWKTFCPMRMSHFMHPNMQAERRKHFIHRTCAMPRTPSGHLRPVRPDRHRAFGPCTWGYCARYSWPEERGIIKVQCELTRRGCIIWRVVNRLIFP